MKEALDHFILAIPVLFIQQYPYTWISSLHREHAFKDGNFYLDPPPFSWLGSARKIIRCSPQSGKVLEATATWIWVTNASG
jgi:hypothetical protein